MKRKEDIISTDFQGWPVYKMNIREIIETICEHKDGQYFIRDDEPILNLYPRVLEDDGMGYGVNEKSITEFSIGQDKSYCNIFVEEKSNDIG